MESDKRRTGDIRFTRVRYFGIHDHIKEGLIELVEVPTEEMASDHFTKPVQGARKLWGTNSNYLETIFTDTFMCLS
jgi:hypothetical protein